VSKRTRDIESLHKNASDLLDQYVELLCLPAEAASLLFPLKSSPRRRHNARRRRLATRALQRNEQSKTATPSPPVLPVRRTRQLSARFRSVGVILSDSNSRIEQRPIEPAPGHHPFLLRCFPGFGLKRPPNGANSHAVLLGELGDRLPGGIEISDLALLAVI
jgi:hypothetical protein